jgi:type I restriction enzyme S subunit
MEFVNTHAAVPGLDRAQVYAREIALPPSDIVDRFATVFWALHGPAINIKKTAVALEVIRDLLLPKLVTGQIDVSNLKLEEATGT